MILSGPGRGTDVLLDPIAQPAQERERLLGIAQREQGTDRVGCVAHPGEAVVPVPLATELLGQGRRGRRHQRTGRRVGHQLQRHGRAADHLAPAPAVGGGGDPGAPEAGRPLEQLPSSSCGTGWGGVSAALSSTTPNVSLARTTRLSRTSSPCLLQAGGAVQREPQVTAGEDRALIGDLERVPLAGVVEAGRALQAEPHLAADAPHDAHDPVPIGRDRRVVGDGHEVDDLGDALFGHEARDQYRRVREVELLDDVPFVFGRDAEVAAAAVVQDAGEDGRGVEARAAVPVDGAVGRDQGGSLEVADQPMLGNGRARRGLCFGSVLGWIRARDRHGLNSASSCSASHPPTSVLGASALRQPRPWTRPRPSGYLLKAGRGLAPARRASGP